HGSSLGPPVHALRWNGGIRLRFNSGDLLVCHFLWIAFLPHLERPQSAGKSVAVDAARSLRITASGGGQPKFSRLHRPEVGSGHRPICWLAWFLDAHAGRPLGGRQSRQGREGLRRECSGLHSWSAAGRLPASALDQRTLGAGAALLALADHWPAPHAPARVAAQFRATGSSLPVIAPGVRTCPGE